MFAAMDLERLKAAVMARANLTVSDYYDDANAPEFVDQVVQHHQSMFPAYTVDELLLRPRCALQLCDAVRMATKYHELSDDVVLRALLNRRKNPNA